MSEWKKVKLGECCFIGDGAHASLKRQEKGILYITAKNLTSNGLDYSRVDYISEELYNKHFSEKNGAITRPIKNDIIFSIIGSLGDSYLVKDEKLGISSSVAIFRSKGDILPLYLFYYLKSEKIKSEIDSIKGGVAQGFMSLSKLGSLTIYLPTSLKLQQRIAETLSRYDSLIENYQKQIKLLEESAQRLYKEWFIDLRFPGHENTKIVDGVPEGWEKKKLIELVNVQYGYAFDGKLFNSNGNGMPILRIRNIPDGMTSDYTTEEASEDYIVHNGDIVVGMDGIFHINTWSGKNAYLVQRVCSFRPIEEGLKGFVLQAIKEPIKYYEQTLVGATVAHLGKKHIDSIEVIVPNNKELFGSLQKMFNQRQNMLNQIRYLTEARDRLLPKLMSGEIVV